MTNRIDEMSWTEFDKRRKETDIVIIPTGAVEIYGPHLPMGSDGIVAMAISELVAGKTGALVAPLLPLGESSALTCYPGTLTVSRETLQILIKEVFLQLIDYGFKNFLFITGHAGNVDPINYYSRLFQIKYGIRSGQVDWWRFAARHGKDIFENEGFMAHGHASECGTSVLLYFRPDLVNMDEATRIEPNRDFYTKFDDVFHFIPLNVKTPNATVGDATVASAEKGKLIVDKCVGRILEFMDFEFKS